VTVKARRAPVVAAGILAAVSLCGGSCATYSDALARGQRYYEDNQYERALALWRDLDRREAEAEFEPAERARYAYFRGMTDYRLGYRDDARHWLAIARAADGAQSALGAVWLERIDNALADLEHSSGRAVGAADLVQTIEAPPGTVLPVEPSSDAAPRGVAGPSTLGGPAPEEPSPDTPAADAGTRAKPEGNDNASP
jgi:hypothetical protein